MPGFRAPAGRMRSVPGCERGQAGTDRNRVRLLAWAAASIRRRWQHSAADERVVIHLDALSETMFPASLAFRCAPPKGCSRRPRRHPIDHLTDE